MKTIADYCPTLLKISKEDPRPRKLWMKLICALTYVHVTKKRTCSLSFKLINSLTFDFQNGFFRYRCSWLHARQREVVWRCCRLLESKKWVSFCQIPLLMSIFIACFIFKLTGFHLLCRNRGISQCHRGILPPRVEGAVSRNLSKYINGNCRQFKLDEKLSKSKLNCSKR